MLLKSRYANTYEYQVMKLNPEDAGRKNFKLII